MNKNYNEVPFENDIFFEVFDTEKFLDTEIESNIMLKIKGIKESEIIKMYKNMPLENRKDLKIKFEEIQKITQKESQEVKKIEEKMINKILKGELKNKKSHLLNYLKKEGA